MKLLRLNALSPNFQLPQTAVTIGNFDGVHLGHQAMIAQLKNCCSTRLKTLVMILSHNLLSSLKVIMHLLVLIHYGKKLNT